MFPLRSLWTNSRQKPKQIYRIPVFKKDGINLPVLFLFSIICFFTFTHPTAIALKASCRFRLNTISRCVVSRALWVFTHFQLNIRFSTQDLSGHCALWLLFIRPCLSRKSKIHKLTSYRAKAKVNFYDFLLSKALKTKPRAMFHSQNLSSSYNNSK